MRAKLCHDSNFGDIHQEIHFKIISISHFNLIIILNQL